MSASQPELRTGSDSSSPASGDAPFANKRIQGFRTKVVDGENKLEVKMANKYKTVSRMVDIPEISDWLETGALGGYELGFYVDVEKSWRAFVDFGARIGPFRDSFNIFIEQTNASKCTSLPENRPIVRSEELGVLYYNASEDVSTKGTIYSSQKTGKGPLATRVHLSSVRPDIVLLKETLYRID